MRIEIAQLETAINRCRIANPATGRERTLHPDTDKLADLWANMVFMRSAAADCDSLPPEVVEAFDRWKA